MGTACHRTMEVSVTLYFRFHFHQGETETTKFAAYVKTKASGKP